MKASIMTARLMSTLLISTLGYSSVAQASINQAEPVILLHGLARSASSMHKMESALQQAGYQTCNLAYPSREHDVATLTRNHITPALERCFPGYEGRLHFVTHSMGGILVRQLAMDERYARRIGRVVMMGTPNHGSEVIDHLSSWKVFQRIAGPAGPQLGTDHDSTPQQLGPAIFEAGIFAGNISFNPLLSLLLTGQDDGKVSIESTKLEGMRDFHVLRSSHAFIMRNPQAIRQTLHFLSHGSFSSAGLPL